MYNIKRIMYLMLIACFLLLVKFGEPQCSDDCSTYSVEVGDYERKLPLNIVPCKVQSQSCSSLNDSVAPAPNPNILDYGYYIYYNPDDNLTKIGLNVSWQAVQTVSIRSIRGHKIQIRNKNQAATNVFTKYFCLQKQLNFHNHAHAVYFYDCYDYQAGQNVFPGEKYSVSITNVNANGQSNSITIKLPKCGDESMARVTECVLKDQLKSSVSAKTCGEAAIVYNYNMPVEYGQVVTVTVARIGSSSNVTMVIKDYRLPNQTSSQVVIPVQHNNANYSVTAKGENMNRYVLENVVYVGECPSDALLKTVIPISIVSCICIAIIVVLAWNKIKNKPKQTGCEEISVTEKVEEQDEHITNKSILILYSTKNEAHENLVQAFASFLCEELGLPVSLECWGGRFLGMSKSDWIEEKINKSGKVVTIWSPEAKEQWAAREEFNRLETVIVPALIIIKRNLMFSENNQKFFFTYFEHDTNAVIPEDWAKEVHYCLMDNFKDLYFRIIEKEQYQPESSLRVEMIEEENGKWNPVKYGLKLKKALDEFKNGRHNIEESHSSFPSRSKYKFIRPNFIPIIPPMPVEIFPSNNHYCPYHPERRNLLTEEQCHPTGNSLYFG